MATKTLLEEHLQRELQVMDQSELAGLIRELRSKRAPPPQTIKQRKAKKAPNEQTADNMLEALAKKLKISKEALITILSAKKRA